MKSHFLRLFDYDCYANRAMNELIVKYGAPGNSATLMAHLLTTPQVWLQRCKSVQAHTGPVWPDLPVESFAAIIEQNHTDWTEFLSGLKEADYSRVITYTRTTGEFYENILSDIIAHVINHGTHHRSKIGQQLKLNQLVTLPPTDYVIYRREADQNL
ncbi:hypothetical protein FPZ43_02340 [Mucilaginibacter pallidiroseus]|uniref:DinB-like domain-containing protein n=1 Tax=Mucilaginibacter pallidiroseus TaxID=2599295 RepID=A0A563UJ68_9SPHI|nr:DinB family protein [Mucilaginibacter pallidiroseus]TWR31336.1 hypothetical protein FPZ43_02340 [Mucilaginibacter pallidiroseus]